MVASATFSKPRYAAAVLIPVYNHEDAIGHTLQQVMQYDYPVLLVDDGSNEACRAVLIELSNTYGDKVYLLRLEENGGKGAAVKAGFNELAAKNFSHALQIDADGQHDAADLPRFMEKSRTNPDSLVTGYPQFDNIPVTRYYFRYLTLVWVWINTLSFTVKDAMCGFRIYPLRPINRMLAEEFCGDRMDFDAEILVRWSWRGGSIINLPTRVRYPLDGVSHFNLLKDNLLITWMHTRLFFGMLYRLPVIAWRKLNA